MITQLNKQFFCLYRQLHYLSHLLQMFFLQISKLGKKSLKVLFNLPFHFFYFDGNIFYLDFTSSVRFTNVGMQIYFNFCCISFKMRLILQGFTG